MLYNRTLICFHSSWMGGGVSLEGEQDDKVHMEKEIPQNRAFTEPKENQPKPGSTQT